MNFTAVQKAVEGFFDDVCSVRASKEILTDWGESRLEDLIVLEEMACKMVNLKELSSNHELHTDGKKYATLLYPVTHELQKGNKIILYRFNGKQEKNFITVCQTRIYHTHHEIDILEL